MTESPLTLSIHLEFTYTYNDIRAANKFMSLLRYGRKLRFILAITFAASLVVLFYKPITTTPLIPLILLLIPCIIVLLMLALFLIYRARQARVRWEKNHAFTLQIVTISESGLTWHNPNSHLQNNWSAYKHFAENSAFFLLYVSDNLSAPLPKRAMTPDQIQQIRLLLQSHIGKTHAFPVLPPK